MTSSEVRYTIIERKPDEDTTSKIRELTVANHADLSSALNDLDIWRKQNPRCYYLIRPATPHGPGEDFEVG